MKCGTSSSTDGIILEFFKEYCPFIGYDYLVMISQVVNVEKFLLGVTIGIIANFLCYINEESMSR